MDRTEEVQTGEENEEEEGGVSSSSSNDPSYIPGSESGGSSSIDSRVRRRRNIAYAHRREQDNRIYRLEEGMRELRDEVSRLRPQHENRQ